MIQEKDKITVHKAPSREARPRVSVILLDWSVREYYQSLHFLHEQDVPRDHYELIWVELYDRVAPIAMEKADWVITCNQSGNYHKHIGYNVGLLHARGEIVTVCDSDAVFPQDFIASSLRTFEKHGADELRSLVLMHYQWRTASLYPDSGLASRNEIAQYSWAPLWPNVGACMSVQTADAIRFGGFDEHRSYRGYWCGPYDLGWRMVNAGIPEIWHDPSTAIWHFAHTNPSGEFLIKNTRKVRREKSYPHVDFHAYTAMEAFASGRLLPRQENSEVFARRMATRRIGTEYEQRLAAKAGPQGFGTLYFLKQYFKQILMPEIGFARALQQARYKLGLRTRLKALRGVFGKQIDHSPPSAHSAAATGAKIESGDFNS